MSTATPNSPSSANVMPAMPSSEHDRRVARLVETFESEAQEYFDSLPDQLTAAEEARDQAETAYSRERNDENLQNREDAQALHDRIAELLDGGVGAFALERAETFAVSARQKYASQVAMRTRQTAPIAPFAHGQWRADPATKDAQSRPGFSNRKVLAEDSLLKAQANYEVALGVIQQVAHDKYAESDPTATEGQLERRTREFMVKVLFAEPDADENIHKGQLRQLNSEIAAIRILSSGHHTLNKDGEVELKGGRFHKYHDLTTRLYEKWGAWGETRSKRLARGLGVAAVGAVAAATAGLAGAGIAGAGLVALGTRTVKTGSTLWLHDRSDKLTRAEADASDNENAFDSLFAPLDNDSRGTNFAELINTTLSGQFTTPAQETYKQNRNRALVGVAAFAGGALLGEVAHLALGGSSSSSLKSIPSSPSASPTENLSNSPSASASHSPSATASHSPSSSPSSASPSHEASPSGSQSASPTNEASPSNSQSPSGEASPTSEPTPTETPSASPSPEDGGTETDGPDDGSGSGSGEQGGESDGGTTDGQELAHDHGDRDVKVHKGEGLSELNGDHFDDKYDVELTDEQQWELFKYEEARLEDGHFFGGKNWEDKVYMMEDGHYGISESGPDFLSRRNEILQRQWFEANKDKLEAAA